MIKSPDVQRRDIVLVVDDSPETLRLLTDALDTANMTVMVALDGEAAMRIVEQVTPDIILLDAIMFGLDGFEVCRRLKLNPVMAGVPVIFMTGLADTDSIVKGFEAGGVDYVTKPIVVQEMLARIRAHLGNARMTQSARTALDASGRFLFAIDRDGQILWATPQAQRLLSPDGTLRTKGLRATALADWIALMQTDPVKANRLATVEIGGQALRVQFISRSASGEFLLRIEREALATEHADVGKELGLTARETEVLGWLSKGKTNRDIAQILGLSPRTIDKHLEQIYAKLGVENRTAATAVVMRKIESDTR